MIPLGSIVNALAIIGGSLVGCWLQSRFPERIRAIVFQGTRDSVSCSSASRWPSRSKTSSSSSSRSCSAASPGSCCASTPCSNASATGSKKLNQVQERQVHRRADHRLAHLLHRGHGHHRLPGGRHPGQPHHPLHQVHPRRIRVHRPGRHLRLGRALLVPARCSCYQGVHDHRGQLLPSNTSPT